MVEENYISGRKDSASEDSVRDSGVLVTIGKYAFIGFLGVSLVAGIETCNSGRYDGSRAGQGQVILEEGPRGIRGEPPKIHDLIRKVDEKRNR